LRQAWAFALLTTTTKREGGCLEKLRDQPGEFPEESLGRMGSKRGGSTKQRSSLKKKIQNCKTIAQKEELRGKGPPAAKQRQPNTRIKRNLRPPE